MEENGRNIGFGIDIGGSGMKAAPVDLDNGSLTAERYRIDTPQPATPSAMAKVVKKLKGDEETGARSVMRALEAPARLIASNAGLEDAIMIAKVEEAEGTVGLNAATGDIEDLMAAGITDPAKVTRAALQNAASIAALVLTTEVLVSDLPEEAGAMPAGMPDMGGMGGMM